MTFFVVLASFSWMKNFSLSSAVLEKEEDDTQHSHLIRKENRTSSQAGKDSSPRPTQSQSKELSHERDSSVSDHKEHHQHHEQHHHQQHSKKLSDNC
jgi:hypothetical protein